MEAICPYCSFYWHFCKILSGSTMLHIRDEAVLIVQYPYCLADQLHSFHHASWRWTELATNLTGLFDTLFLGYFEDSAASFASPFFVVTQSGFLELLSIVFIVDRTLADLAGYDEVLLRAFVRQTSLAVAGGLCQPNLTLRMESSRALSSADLSLFIPISKYYNWPHSVTGYHFLKDSNFFNSRDFYHLILLFSVLQSASLRCISFSLLAKSSIRKAILASNPFFIFCIYSTKAYSQLPALGCPLTRNYSFFLCSQAIFS